MIQAVSPDEVRRITADVLQGPEFQKSFDPWQMAWDGFSDGSETGTLGGGESRRGPDACMALTLVLVFFCHIAYTVGTSISCSAALRLQPGKSAVDEGSGRNCGQLGRSLPAGKGCAGGRRFIPRALDYPPAASLGAGPAGSAAIRALEDQRDYLRECRAGEAASWSLADVSAAYERVIYAHSDINPDQAARCWPGSKPS